ncbi:unnamed protein product [Oikopleura dioica]|uniref:Uncharacterized protein n=1 Tax=Oikopleura dioica TaxID=34765 RepID=E4WVY6_OIKDI|nr:unnamed protein product [Oikopleura dioica]
MLVNFGILARENFHHCKKDPDSKEAEVEDVSRLVFDEVQDNTLAPSALHYTPFYCNRDYVYQFEVDYPIIYKHDYMAEQFNYNTLTSFTPLSSNVGGCMGSQLIPASHSAPPRSAAHAQQQITGPILVQSGGQTFTLVPNTFEARASMEGKIESKTNIYIKIRPLRERYHLNTLNQVENYLREIFSSITASMGLDIEKRSSITPKVTVPEASQEFLFVDFESKLPGLSADVAKKFVAEINDQVGPNTAQYAKEKLRDKTNVYFQPLPFNCTKEDLQEVIAQRLAMNNMEIDWTSNEVTCHVQAGKDGKNPVGFCRLPTQDHAQSIIDMMNNRQWRDLGMTPGMSEPNHRIIVKLANAKASRPRQTVIFADSSQFMNQPIQIVASPVQILPVQGINHHHHHHQYQQTVTAPVSNQASLLPPPPPHAPPAPSQTSQPLNTFAAVDAAFGINQVPFASEFFGSSAMMNPATTHYAPMIGPFGSPERAHMTDSLSSFPSSTNTSNCYHPLTNPTF